MKRSQVSAMLPLLCALLGALGCWLLRFILTELDDRGLIIPGTMQQYALLGLTIAAAAAALVAARNTVLGKAGPLSGAASLVLAAGIFTMKDMVFTAPVILVKLHTIVGVLAIAALLGMGIMQLLGKTPPFFLQAIVCIFSILQLVVCYQLWNERPQFLAYIFGAGAVLCVMLFAYGLTERASGIKSHRFTVFSGVLGVFFCAAAAAQGECSWFFAAAAVWQTLELSALTTEA